jgi:hypothetical protein
MVRPLKEVDWKKVDELMMAGCLGTEIAAYFGMHEDTFYKKVAQEKKMGFSAYLQLKHSHGESILRAHQYAKALGLTEKGDNTLLIWLGKTRLRQKEEKTIGITSYTIKIDKDGLATGVSTEKLSASDTESTE